MLELFLDAHAQLDLIDGQGFPQRPLGEPFADGSLDELDIFCGKTHGIEAT